MRRAFAISAVLALSWLPLLAGCGGGGGGSSPGEVLLRSVRAMKNRDLQAYMACFTGGSNDEIEATKASFDLSLAAHDFQKALEGRYGPAAWEQFYKTRDPWSEGVLPQDDQRWIERVLIKVEGDMATCEIPNSPIAVKIVRRDGAWRMHMASMYSGRDPKADTRISKRLAAKFRELQGKIGQGGETIDTLRQEYERERQAIQQEFVRGG